MGCDAWLDWPTKGTDARREAPWFRSDSKAFGNWIAAIWADSDAKRLLGAAADALLAIRADWLDRPPAWVTPASLRTAATHLRDRLLRAEPDTRRLAALYEALGYGGSPQEELAADLEDLVAMAAWAERQGITQVGIRVDYPDAPSPTGLRVEVVYGVLDGDLGGALRSLGYTRVGDGPLRYEADSGRAPAVEIATTAYAAWFTLNLGGERPPLSRAQVRSVEEPLPVSQRGQLFSPYPFRFADLHELRAWTRRLAGWLPEWITKSAFLAGSPIRAEGVSSVMASDPDFRAVVAASPYAPDTILAQLADADTTLASAVAANPTAPRGLLARLAAYPAAAVREAVARNQRTHPDLLRQLAADPTDTVRAAVAEHKETPVDVLTSLAGSEDPVARAAALRNPRLPSTVTERLASSESPEARAGIARQTADPELASRLVDDPDEGVRLALSRNLKVPLEVVARLVADAPVAFRLKLAGGPKTRPDLLGLLVKDPEVDVRFALAKCPHKLRAVYVALAQDGSAEVQRAATERLRYGTRN